MKVLVACEFSGIVRDAFASRGHNAWSCDLLPSERPEGNHIQGNVLDIIDRGWDLMIAHPPCTHLAVSGAKHFKEKQADGRQQRDVEFFMMLATTEIHKVCIENPVGIMSRIFRKPDQIVQPWFFGDEFQKTTCLWLKNLLPLHHRARPDLFDDTATHVGKGEFVIVAGKKVPKWYANTPHKNNKKRSKKRSRIFPGIAEAMAEQWG